MCSGSQQSKLVAFASESTVDNKSDTGEMCNSDVKTEYSFSRLLELAAENDVEGFKQWIEDDVSALEEVGCWYVRKRGSNQIAMEHRTPLMVAASYGTVDVLKLIISQPGVDINCICGLDKCTALHSAVSGGSENVVEVVELLLSAGANPNLEDANGLRPADLIVLSPRVSNVRVHLEELLKRNVSDGPAGGCNLQESLTSTKSSPTLSSENGSLCSLDSVLSPMGSKLSDSCFSASLEKKEYPIDPSLPCIKDSTYSTDEFRMFFFKVRPCSRAYSHDWTECPFAHPGENARRRDPRKYHYSCVPCPDFRTATCKRGDMCEYAHGVFECWLHPAQYRTRLCKDGTSCTRRVCFFAHTPEELRPLYVSNESSVPSPRSTALSTSVMDMAAALRLLSGSPSPHLSPAAVNQNQPLSPLANGVSHLTPAWPQPNVPMLQLPGSNLQSSRLRCSLNARDMHPLGLNQDFEGHKQLPNDITCPQLYNTPVSLNYSDSCKALTPSNLEDLFSAESNNSLPVCLNPALASGVFSPSQNSSFNPSEILQQPRMLSPVHTNVLSSKSVGHSFQQDSFGVPSPGRMTPRFVEPISPMGVHFSGLSQREKQHFQPHSLSSHDLGFNNARVEPHVKSWSNWGSPNGKADWSFKGDEPNKLQWPSFESNNNDEKAGMKHKLAAPV